MIARTCRIIVLVSLGIVNNWGFQAAPLPCRCLSSAVFGHRPTVRLLATQEPVREEDSLQSVKVCQSKDCRRRGGGERLLKQIQSIAKAEQWTIPIIEGCDCLGECGYGPNIVVNGKLINHVGNNPDAIRQAVSIMVGTEEKQTEETSV